MPKLLIGIIGIAVIGVGVVLVLAAKAPRAPVVEKNVAQDASIASDKVAPPKNVPTSTNVGKGLLFPSTVSQQSESLDAETKTKLELERKAATFVERFLSYSSDGGFENVESLKILMTPKARAFVDKFKNNVAQGFRDPSSVTGSSAHKFYGISTKSIATEVITLQADFATVKIETQRQEVKDSESKIFNQDVEVNLVRQESDWFIDGIFLKAISDML